METITLGNDIKVFYVTADSFLAGIKEAEEKISEIAAFSKGRKFFGISRPEKGTIVYRATAE